MFERELEKYTSEPFTLFFLYIYLHHTAVRHLAKLKRT